MIIGKGLTDFCYVWELPEHKAKELEAEFAKAGSPVLVRINSTWYSADELKQLLTNPLRNGGVQKQQKYPPRN